MMEKLYFRKSLTLKSAQVTTLRALFFSSFHVPGFLYDHTLLFIIIQLNE